jgi:sortase A
MRRALRGLSTVLIVAGSLLATDAVITFAWQEPVTALWTKLRQNRLSDELAALERAGPTPIEARALERLHGDRRRVAFLARSLKRRAERGRAVGRIRIPRSGTNFVLVNGSRPEDLRKGPGIYDETPFPGAPGTTAIAGHRTTYLAPFRRIDRLRAGDRVFVDMPYAHFTYRVEGHRIVDPSDVGVIERVRYDRLVLTACHPLYSATKRWVVFARLEGVQRSSKDSSTTTEAPDRRAEGGDRSRHSMLMQRHRKPLL